MTAIRKPFCRQSRRDRTAHNPCGVAHGHGYLDAVAPPARLGTARALCDEGVEHASDPPISAWQDIDGLVRAVLDTDYDAVHLPIDRLQRVAPVGTRPA